MYHMGVIWICGDVYPILIAYISYISIYSHCLFQHSSLLPVKATKTTRTQLPMFSASGSINSFQWMPSEITCAKNGEGPMGHGGHVN